MIAWLRIDGERVLQFYRDAGAVALMDLSYEQHPYLSGFGTVRETTEGETPNTTATLTVDAIGFFDDPPIGALATFKSDSGDWFFGIVQDIKISADGVSMGIEQ